MIQTESRKDQVQIQLEVVQVEERSIRPAGEQVQYQETKREQIMEAKGI
jgi:hypothetical protein